MLIAFLLIFSSSLFSCFISILLKKNTSTSTILLSNVFGGLLFFPIYFFIKNDLKHVTVILHYLVFSGIAYGIVSWLTAKIYKKSTDISFMVPMQKAFSVISAVLISFIIGFFTNSKVNISPLAYIGYGLVTLSCFILPIKNFKDITLKNYLNEVTFLCFLSAVFGVISFYLDSACINILPKDLSLWKKTFIFIGIDKFFIAIGMIPFLWFDDIKCGVKFTKEKPDLLQALILGFSSGICYLLVLISCDFVKETSYLVVLRFMSIPIIMFGGFLTFKEKIYIGKSLGAFIMILGLIITVLG